jgi:hypothetical protein
MFLHSRLPSHKTGFINLLLLASSVLLYSSHVADAAELVAREDSGICVSVYFSFFMRILT